MYSTIVHPTDLSEESIPALKTAHDLAKQFGAKLIVYFVAHPPLIASGDTLTDPKTNESRNIAEEVEAFQPSDPAVQRDVRIVITEQKTRVKSLLAMLEDMGCDVIVLGMHRRAGVAGWMGPSITEEVVRRAKCAVLVAKHHGPESVVEVTDDVEAASE